MGDVHDSDGRPTNPPGPRLFQTTQRAQDVQAWAQRMHDKRAARRASADTEDEPNHWSSDALFENSRQVTEEEQYAADSIESRSALLATFGLGSSATSQEVTKAFHDLAKLHHPDRYALASAEVQAHHSEAMIKLNKAYRALKTP